MQKLVLFIDSGPPKEDEFVKDYGLASNIGHIYMNRFIIDEDGGNEIVKIYEIEELYKIVEEKERMGHIFF